MKKYFLLWISFFALLIVYGQAGNLDQNFAGKGWNAFYFGQSWNNSDETAKKLLRQTDGKYIMVIQVYGENYSLLARYNINGTIDSSFGTNGFSDPIKLYEATSAAFQNVGGDVKIVVAGAVEDINYVNNDFGITRFNSDGTLDRNFGAGGKVITDFYGDNDAARVVAVQDFDNKIVVAGSSIYAAGYSDFAIARYNIDGSLDQDFGTGGKLSTDFFGNVDYVNALVIQSDHKILVAGAAHNSSVYYDFGLVRYNSDGSLDTDFGTGGKVNTDLNNHMDIPSAIAIQNIGGLNKIVVVGNTWATLWDYGLVRYNYDGTLDTGFDIDGKITLDFNNTQNEASDVAIQIDNKILVAGNLWTATTGYDYGLVRFNVDGSFDATGFGNVGVLATDAGSFGENANSIFLTGTHIMVAGGTRDPEIYYAGGYDFSLLSFDYSGNMVTSFGTGGMVTGYYTSGWNSYVSAVAVQLVNAEKKTLVVGTANGDFAMTRYNADGTPDTNFGENGIVLTNFWGNENAVAVALQTLNGVEKIVVAGTSRDYDSDDPSFALIRYHADGTIDESFAYSGKTLGSINGIDVASGMAIQNDGKIIMTGQSAVYDPIGDSLTYDFGMIRFSADGIVDSTFGNNGIVMTDFFGYPDSSSSIAIQAGGKIIVAGKAMNANGSVDFAIARYSITGTLDASFGTGGKITTDFGGNLDVATSIATQTDGKILVAGYETAVSGSSQNFALARYTSKGKPDLNFGIEGKLTTDFNGTNDVAYSVALQSDGKILVTGSSEVNAASGNQFDVAIARYTTEGLPDPVFGNNQSGKMISDLGYNEFISSSIWNNDRLYVAGTGSVIAGFAFPSTVGIIAVYETSATTLPAITINDVIVNEGDTARLTLGLDQAGTSAIIINYATQDATATGKGKNPDYKGTKGTVLIPAGETTVEIKIATYGDNLAQEGSETFNVNLTLNNQMQNLAMIDDGIGVVTIEDVVLVVNAKTPIVTLPGKLSVIVFPNPSNDQFTLQLQSRESATVSMKIMDATGRIIEAREGISANGRVNLGINYRPGVYYAQILHGSEIITMKLIKQK